METRQTYEKRVEILDIITALEAVAQAINITKDLRDIDRGLDAAAYKAKMAEIYDNLAEVKMALTDARESLHNKDQQIRSLVAEIDALKSGDTCPLCNIGRMKITASKPHLHLGTFGVQERILTCQNPECRHEEPRIFDPSK